MIASSSCIMSPVCGLSNICPRTSTQRLLTATLRAAAAVAAASQTNVPVSSLSSVKSFSSSSVGAACCNSEESICAGNNNSDGVVGDCNSYATVGAVSVATSSHSALPSSGFKCPRCPRAYALSYTLERHMKYECGVAKQFGCFKCGKRFSRRDILKAHISNTRLHCAAAVAAAVAVDDKKREVDDVSFEDDSFSVKSSASS